MGRDTFRSFGPKFSPLVYPEAVLLIDYRKTEILEDYIVLDQHPFREHPGDPAYPGIPDPAAQAYLIPPT